MFRTEQIRCNRALLNNLPAFHGSVLGTSNEDRGLAMVTGFQMYCRNVLLAFLAGAAMVLDDFGPS
jgi:hypothetical protein